MFRHSVHKKLGVNKRSPVYKLGTLSTRPERGYTLLLIKLYNLNEFHEILFRGYYYHGS